MTISSEWRLSGFTVSSNIIRVIHNLSEGQAVLHRGLIGLSDRQSSVASIIAAQKMYPSAEAEVFVFPEIINLDVTGIAVRQYKAPIDYSWSWQIQVDSWVNLDNELAERFLALEGKLDALTDIATQILGLLP